MSAMVACGGSGNTGSGTNPQTTENSQTTDNGGAKSGNILYYPTKGLKRI